MTREEAVADIKQCLEDNKWGCGKYTEAFCWAMYALNEDCVIEDIKAEIDKIEIPEDVKTVDGSFAFCQALEIVDLAIDRVVDNHISGKENE